MHRKRGGIEPAPFKTGQIFDDLEVVLDREFNNTTVDREQRRTSRIVILIGLGEVSVCIGELQLDISVITRGVELRPLLDGTGRLHQKARQDGDRIPPPHSARPETAGIHGGAGNGNRDGHRKAGGRRRSGSSQIRRRMTEEIIEARRKIVETARKLLSGSLSFIEGARAITALSHKAKMNRDDDIVPFAAIDSETDAFPLGKVRELWNADALDRLQPDIDKAEEWVRDCAIQHCHNLIARFSD